MSNELIAIGQPGLSLTARLVQGTTQVGSAITLTEAPGLAGHYTGSVPGGTAAGVYSVQVLNGGLPIAAAELRWDGTAEVRPALPSDVPTASTTAAAVRSNLATELARIDVAVSTRESEASAATRATANQTEHDATQATLASGTLQVDLRKVNGIAVDGSGTPADPWGPV